MIYDSASCVCVKSRSSGSNLEQKLKVHVNFRLFANALQLTTLQPDTVTSVCCFFRVIFHLLTLPGGESKQSKCEEVITF